MALYYAVLEIGSTKRHELMVIQYMKTLDSVQRKTGNCNSAF